MPASALSGAQHIGTLPDGRKLVRLSCSAAEAFTAQDGSQWAQIVPGGQFVKAVDGRSFQITDPLKAVANSNLPLLVDWEHESESWMGSTEAAGWLEDFKVQFDDIGEFPRAGVWGLIEWTADGSADVKGKKYRYLSPVLALDPETRDVLQIISVALTNKPALQMQGLDAYRQRFTAQFGQLQGERNMKPETIKLLLTALALADGATDEQVIAAFNARLASPSAEAFAKLSNELNRVTAENTQLTSKLAEFDKAAFAAEVKQVIDDASKDGKVPPAARPGVEALCATREGFENFKANILPHLVSIGAPAPRSNPGPKSTKYSAELTSRFTAEELAAAEKLRVNGQSAEED